MVYTETSHAGWFGRIGSAIKGVVFGLILFFVSFILLFWNEGRAVHTARTLEEGKSAVVSVDSGKIDPANEGKEIHFTGRAINSSGQKLVDSSFGVSLDAIHLRRKVAMYQWKEEKRTESHKDAVGGGTTDTTTYSYSKEWEKDPIDSSGFKESGHENPNHWRLSSTTLDAPTVTVGAFTLDESLVGMINNFTPVILSATTIDGLSADLKPDAVYSNNSLYFADKPGQKVDPNSPQIGDLQLSYEAVLPGDVSVIARQSGSLLAPYHTKNNDLELLYVGNHSADEMFKTENQKNATLTWILRGAGFVAMWIGLALMLNPLKVLSDVVGIIGDIVGAGIGIMTGVIAIAFSFITVAIAWIAYRPIIGLGLLIVAGGAIALFFVLRSKGASQRRASGAVQPVGQRSS